VTSFLDSKGVEVEDSRKIFKKYVSSVRFILDLLPLLGSSIFSNIHTNFKLFGLFKITRVIRLGKIISQLNLPKDIKAFFILVKLTVYLLLWFHSMACGWYMIVYQHKYSFVDGVPMKWIPPLDFHLDYDNSLLLAVPD